MFDVLRKISAAALLALTIATLLVMWNPSFWAIAVPEVGSFCIAAVWLVSSLVSGRPLRSSFVLFALVAAVLWCVMQLATGVAIYRWATSLATLYWATAAAIVFSALQIFDDESIRRFYLRALVVTGFVFAILAPLQLFTADGKIFWMFEVRYSNVAMGPFVYPNQYAAFIELLLPVALTLIFFERTGWRAFHGLAAIVMYASIFASTSRMGFVLTSLEVLIVPLLAAKRTGIRGRQMAISGAIFVGGLVVLGMAVGPERLIGKLQQSDPYQGRREFVESSLRMIQDKPLLGVGMGNWPTAYPAYALFDDGLFANQAHNDWAQWAVEGGLPFFLLMISVAVWTFPKAIRSGWGVGAAVVFLHCLIDYPIQRMGGAIVFFSLLGAIAFRDEQTGSLRKSRHSRNAE
jgi:O-antigen ligase